MSCARKTFFILCDYLIWLVIIVPLVTTYWRGTWNLMDFYIGKNTVKNIWSCWFVGASGLIIMNLLQYFLLKFNPNKIHLILWLVLSRLHAYVVSFFYVCLWRGVWNAWEIYAGKID